MTAAQMATAGNTAYGPQWEGILAKNIGIASSKVHRWTLSTEPMPVKVFRQQQIARTLKTTW